jgi:hypothetical protein
MLDKDVLDDLSKITFMPATQLTQELAKQRIDQRTNLLVLIFDHHEQSVLLRQRNKKTSYQETWKILEDVQIRHRVEHREPAH